MIVFPHGKINLGLNIIQKRQDGYHDIESVFYPVPCRDVLELRKAEELSFHYHGTKIPGDPLKNSCRLVYDKMSEHYKLPPIEVHLLKCIPMGAGLGGGSADASFLISALNDLFEIGLSIGEMESVALEVGSDCPFFIRPKVAFCEGRGERMTPIELDLSGKQLLLVSTGQHVSTAWAYGQMNAVKPESSCLEIVQQGLSSWRENLSNDFEPIVFEKYPNLARIKSKCYEAGARYASMSGSGSSMYALFDEDKSKHDLQHLFDPNTHRSWVYSL